MLATTGDNRVCVNVIKCRRAATTVRDNRQREIFLLFLFVFSIDDDESARRVFILTAVIGYVFVRYNVLYSRPPTTVVFLHVPPLRHREMCVLPPPGRAWSYYTHFPGSPFPFFCTHTVNFPKIIPTYNARARACSSMFSFIVSCAVVLYFF